MKKVEIKFLKFYNAIIFGLLAILGFATSCEILDSPVGYGTPTAKFIVNGNVKSIETNNAIDNIRVVVQGDSSQTNSQGEFQVEIVEFPIEQTFNIKFKDIDGAINGEYEDLDTVVKFTNPKFTNGDGHWYSGETTKEFDIKLTPRK